MNMCATNRSDLNYEVWGMGERGTLVFVHGSGGDCSKWDQQLQNLPYGFKGLAFDLPGHGESPGPLCTSVAEAAIMVKELIDTLKPARPVILAGHSLGAAISLQTAFEFSELLQGIILIGGGATLRVMPSLLEALGQGKKELGFLKLCFAAGASDELYKQELESFTKVDTDVLFNDFDSCNKFDLREKLNEINLPTLIIVGEEDKMTPLKSSQLLHSGIKNSVLQVVPSAGHYAMKEKPDAVNSLIKQFCARF
ncbi:MAG: alpha/beta hydrolase [Syntrophomonas sp.]